MDGVDESIGIEMEGQGDGGFAVVEGGLGGVGIDGLPGEIAEAGGVPGGLGEEALEFSLGDVVGVAEVDHGEDGEGFDLEDADAFDVGIVDVGVDAGRHVDAGVPIEAGAIGDDALGGGEGDPVGGGCAEVEGAGVGEVDGGDGGLAGREGEGQIAGNGSGESGRGGGQFLAGRFEVGAEFPGAGSPAERSVDEGGEADEDNKYEGAEPHGRLLLLASVCTDWGAG